MKVLKILAIVFGAIALLTGVGMYLGSAAVSKGSEALNPQMSQQGFVGPVDGVVKSIGQPGVYTVEFTDQQGTKRTGSGSAATSQPEVGDTVKLFYYKDSPETIVIADLGSVGTILRTGGLITAGVGLALLLAGILGLLLGTKRPAVPAGQAYPPQPYPGQPQGYPTQQGQQQHYPQQPGQPYPPPQYPTQPGEQQYPPQPGQPGQQYPAQQGYPPQQYPPQQPPQP